MERSGVHMLNSKPGIRKLVRETDGESELTTVIGARIGQARRERDMTSNELAASASMSPARLARIERGEVRPNSGELWNIAVTLTKEISFFFADDIEDARLV